jgi:hypothetical protein
VLVEQLEEVALARQQLTEQHPVLPRLSHSRHLLVTAAV